MVASTIERRDIWKLHEDEGPWNQTVLAYALAFGRLAEPMSKKPGKPDSWDLRYQAAVHDLNPLPPAGSLLATCQHDTWFFLPWHRMYLAHFEAVIRAIIAELDDPLLDDEIKETWALPYWDYQPTNHRTIPPECREATLPNGDPNPLADARRFPAVQSGSQPLSGNQVEYAGWWSQAYFTEPTSPSFGGSDTNGPRHRPVDFLSAGALEATPHGSVHNYVGPDMRSFVTAGLDPVFWMHHCNLDRLWEVWLGGDGTPRSNPSGGDWDTQQFSFLTAEGTVWTRTSKGVESTVTLGYTYEDTSPPTAPPSPTRSRNVGVPDSDDEAFRRATPPRALGSAAASVEMRSDARTVEVDLADDDEVTTRAGRTGEARYILVVGNFEVSAADLERVERDEAVIGEYSLYLEGTRPGIDAFVGNIPLFGLAESMADRHELAYSFDITGAVNVLRTEAAWDAQRVRIRVEPDNHEAYEGAGEVVPVTVGNFTVSFQ